VIVLLGLAVRGPFPKSNRPKAACPGWLLREAGTPVQVQVPVQQPGVLGSKARVFGAEGVRKLRGMGVMS